MNRKYCWLLSALLLTFCSTATAEQKKAGSDKKKDDSFTSQERKEYYELLKTFAATVDQIDRNYVQEISRRELIEAAIEGMLRRLDQYSNYIPPEELTAFRKKIQSDFGGIGLRVTTERGFLEVISPFYGTPAYKSGILAGDRILRIDGQTTRDMTYKTAVRLFQGKPQSPIHLTVLHFGDTQAAEISLKREKIRVQTVLGYKRQADHSWSYFCHESPRIAYVRIAAFGRHTNDELRRVLKELGAQKIQGLVLDLRFNPGGVLTAAIDVSDSFVSSGLIVSTKGRNVEPTRWVAKKDGTLSNLPMTILVNRFSASASEIVAACLQDHKRAIIVGERTWGKGSVQNVIELEGGRSAVKLTTASYHRPNGKNIHRFPSAALSDDWGVKPNPGFSVELSYPETRRLDTYRREQEVISKTTSSSDRFEDRQLERARRHLVATIQRSGQPSGIRSTPRSGSSGRRTSKRLLKKRRSNR